MIEHLWVLVLLAPLALTLFFRNRRYYLRRSTIQLMRNALLRRGGRIGLKKILPYFLFIPAMTLVILAAADYTVGYQKSFKKYIIHNYILLNDGSGSMVDGNLPKGIGPTLTSLIAGNRAFFKTLENIPKENNNRDLVGLIIFSSDPYIVSHPTDDYDNLSKKLDLVDWNLPPLNEGTRLNLALWSAVQMVVKKNGKVGGRQYLEDDLDIIEYGLAGNKRDLKLPKPVEDKTEIIAKEITGTSFIVFTDGIFNLDGSRAEMSTAKILLLCKKLGVRVYLISTQVISSDTISFIKETGGQGRFIRRLEDVKGLQDIYKEIAELQAGEYITEDRPQKQSLYLWFGLPGLGLLFIWLMVKNTISRSLTSV